MSKDLQAAPFVCYAASLRRASRHLTRFYDSALASDGITISQRSILSQVAKADGPTVTELAQVNGLDRTAMGRALTPLVRDGLMIYQSDDADARRKRLLVTRKGRDLLRRSEASWQAAQRDFEARFGVKNAERLHELLEAAWRTELPA